MAKSEMTLNDVESYLDQLEAGIQFKVDKAKALRKRLKRAKKLDQHLQEKK